MAGKFAKSLAEKGQIFEEQNCIGAYGRKIDFCEHLFRPDAIRAVVS